jgi:hypothetical protein
LKKPHVEFCVPVHIAAINPYIEVAESTRALSRVGIKQVIPRVVNKLKLFEATLARESHLYENSYLNRLSYSMRELSDLCKFMVMNAEPKDFGNTLAEKGYMVTFRKIKRSKAMLIDI